MTKEITKLEAQPLAAIKMPVSEAGTFIQQGIKNNISPEGMVELYKIYALEKEREASTAYRTAFAKFQSECPEIKVSGRNNQFTKAGTNQPSEYSTLRDILICTKDCLAKNGLSVHFGNVEIKDGERTIECTLMHSGGFEKTIKHPVVVDSTDVTEKTKTNASQLLAIAITYAKRYAVSNILALGGVDPDHDGNTPEQKEPISKVEVDRINEFIKEKGVDVKRFLKWLKVDSVEEIPMGDYAKAIHELDIAEAKK